jgi:hypothetical protein
LIGLFPPIPAMTAIPRDLGGSSVPSVVALFFPMSAMTRDSGDFGDPRELSSPSLHAWCPGKS